MQDLLARLHSLDPESRAALLVIQRFDDLVARGADLDRCVALAAEISGVPCGVELPELGRSVRSGRRPTASASVPASGGHAWLGCAEPLSVRDRMVLERLAACVGVLVERTHAALEVRGPVATLLGPASPDLRAAALSVLCLAPERPVRVIATPPRSTRSGRAAAVPTPFGVVTALLVQDEVELPRPAGVGPWGSFAELPGAWERALVALRLTGPHQPIVDSEDLGLVLDLIRAVDAGTLPPDVSALVALPLGDLEVLETLALSPSVRAAASSLGLHHSTVQARLQRLDAQLGWRLFGRPGQLRLALALTLYRAHTFRLA